MKKAVASTPANCKVGGAAPKQAAPRSLVGRFVEGAAAHVASYLDDRPEEETQYAEVSPTSWHEGAARYLMSAASIWDTSTSPSGTPTNIYEVASKATAQANTLKTGVSNTLGFVDEGVQDLMSKQGESTLSAWTSNPEHPHLRSPKY